MRHFAEPRVGNSPLAHMGLLARTPERILALRLALSSAVGPSSVVLDAGCGALGVLAIMAARIGARRVVAVDTGQLDTARALAEENGVADRIEFLEHDLADLPADIGSFDVIAGMVYLNEPRRDLVQQRLMGMVATRFAHPRTVFIPGTVRYTVAGYDSASPDPSARTMQDRWDAVVGAAESFSGITMAAISQFPSAEYSARMRQRSQASGSRAARATRPLAGRDMTMLTSRELLTEVNYTDPATAGAYPPALTLPVTTPGRLDTAIWRQELKAGDLLIRRTETIHPLTPPCDVQPGDVAVLAIDDGWDDAIPLTITPRTVQR
jgi:SAM-dependent methyltransferase